MHAYETTHPWLKFSINLSKAPARLWALLGECNSLCRCFQKVALLPETGNSLFNDYLARCSMTFSGTVNGFMTEHEVKQMLDGSFTPPQSQKYIVQKNENIQRGFRIIVDNYRQNKLNELNPELIREYNRIVLDRLALSDSIVPGEYRTMERGEYERPFSPVPAEDCSFLLESLCDWMNSNTFMAPSGMSAMYGLLKAVLAHLYMVWIHPFGNGNLRTSQLMEFHVMIASSIPPPAALLMSIHYTRTKSEYQRLLEQVSSPEGKVQPFVMYAIEGIRDGLYGQIDSIKKYQADALWKYNIYKIFSDKTGTADIRRRQLALDLSDIDESVPLPMLQKKVPQIALAYAKRTYKTLARDIYELFSLGLVEKTSSGIKTRKKTICNNFMFADFPDIAD